MRQLANAPDVRGRLAFWAMAGLALLVTHDAVYLVQLGPGQSLVEALRTSGHEYWGWASVALAAGALLAATSVALRLRHLRRRAAALGASATPTRAFVLQENVEHLATHGHAPGIGALLGAESPLALPVIGVVSGIAAAISSLVAGARASLVEAIDAAMRLLMRAPLSIAHAPVRLTASRGSILANRGAGRAPPALVVSAI